MRELRKGLKMAIFVTMEVGPVDWSKFKSAIDWSTPFRPQERLSAQVYRSDGDPSKVLVVERWLSHAAMHTFQDQYGDEFNKRAGTEGLDWNVTVWNLAESM
jgi:hypothetical protein